MSSKVPCQQCKREFDPFVDRPDTGFRCAFCLSWFCAEHAKPHFGEPKNGE